MQGTWSRGVARSHAPPVNTSKRATGKGEQRLWLTPTAAGPVIAICPNRPVRPSCASHDNVVQWAGRRFQIPPQNWRCSFEGAKVQLYETLDGRIALYYGDTRLEHRNL